VQLNILNLYGFVQKKLPRTGKRLARPWTIGWWEKRWETACRQVAGGPFGPPFTCREAVSRNFSCHILDHGRRPTENPRAWAMRCQPALGDLFSTRRVPSPFGSRLQRAVTGAILFASAGRRVSDYDRTPLPRLGRMGFTRYLKAVWPDVYLFEALPGPRGLPYLKNIPLKHLKAVWPFSWGAFLGSGRPWNRIHIHIPRGLPGGVCLALPIATIIRPAYQF
jgi:hypothetical protein